MFNRGDGSGEEYRRVDTSIYRGIVVKNNDPLRLNRVRIYIPELSNQPFDDWFEKYNLFILKSPGSNTNPKTENEKKTISDWGDVTLFEEMCLTIPWAEPCYPIMGETGSYRYVKDMQISTISDCNYPEGFAIIDTKGPVIDAPYNPTTEIIQSGSFSPAFIYETEEYNPSDNFSNPQQTYSTKGNPYSYMYRPSNHTNKAKGSFGVPEIGSKVWVFHYEGDLNFPVYFGSYRDYRELSRLNKTDNNEKIGVTYPNDFEN